MKFYKSERLSAEFGESMFLLEEVGGQLLMSRQEAEQLFVNIGHTLQDDDVEQFADEGMGDEQPR